MLIKLINLRTVEKRGYFETNTNLHERVNVFCFDVRGSTVVDQSKQFHTYNAILEI